MASNPSAFTAAVNNVAGFTPADPAGTVSATLVTLGLGSTCVFTPAGSGKVIVTLTGYLQIATGIQTCSLGARFGTGTAPANGAADSGTRWGAATDPSVRPPSVGGPCAVTFTGLLALTPGTVYWFDLSLAVPGGAGADAASVKSVSVTFLEA
jgi:hypothetical protein